MKILYLTFYFEPDLCAGSFRNTSLAKELANKLSKNDIVHVITTYPNRYNSYKKEALTHEVIGNIIIDRIKISEHKSGLFDQMKSFYWYFKESRKMAAKENYDLVFASSSRLFTAFLGKTLSIKNKTPLYLDIRDIFVDSISNVVNIFFLKIPLLLVLKLVESFTFSKTTHINLISRGFEQYFNKYNKPSYTFFTNGIDPIFIKEKQNIENSSSHNETKQIVYAGNIGAGQGLHNIIPLLVEILYPNYKFTIIGDGGKKNILEKEIEKRGLKDKIEILPPIGREKLIKIYNNADFLFLHLNRHIAFEKVLPSKIFEYSVFDIPIIAGVEGYSKNFIKKNVSNSIVFEPNNYKELVKKLNTYKYKKINRNDFISSYSRMNINKELVKSILQYI